MAQVEVTSPDAFRAAQAELRREEKDATKHLMSLASKRRSLPAVKVSDPIEFTFTASDGSTRTLPDLFEGRKQLILYHFMLSDNDKEGCMGCTFCMDHIPALGHLNSRDVTFAAVAPAGIEKVNAYKERMGWTFPFYSCKDTFKEAEAKGEDVVWKAENGYFGLAVFIKDGEDILHTYRTTNRGVEVILSTYALLDMTPLGRQEEGNGMNNFKRRDEY